MMVKRALLSCTCAILIVVINQNFLFAASSTLSVRHLRKEGIQIPFRAHRIRRQVTHCNRVGLHKNEAFWKQHNQDQTFSVMEVNYTEYVIVYASKSLKSHVEWVRDFVNIVWDHMQTKTTYKDKESEKGVCLAVIIHQGKYPGDKHILANDKSGSLNMTVVLDIGSLTPNLWTNESKRSEAEDLITNQLAYFVEFSSNGKYGSPSSHIWKSPSSQDSAYVEIFTYDVYMNVPELKGSAPRYKLETHSKSHNTTFPKNETFWFRDWFLPIYEKYGGTTVLHNFFNILAKNVPGFYYEPDNPNKMTMGEFVHFWSGAAGDDLAPLAWNAFGWNRKMEKELKEAQNNYKLKEPFTYNLTYKTYNFTEPEEVDETTTPSGNNGGNSETKKGIDEEDIIIWTSAGASVTVVIIVVFIICIVFIKRKIRSLQTEIRALTQEEVDEFFDGDPNAKLSSDEDQAVIQAMPFIMDYEIPKDQIILARDKVLGTGQFGYVLHGFVRLSETNELVTCAVKLVRPNVDVAYFKAFLMEVKIMAYLGKHENIVDLVGTCTTNIKDREIFIALELCSLGCLLDFVKDNRKTFQSSMRSDSRKGSTKSVHGGGSKRRKSLLPSMISTQPDTESKIITTVDLLKWCQHIANAMVYLTEKKVIHGDLAARNVLLTVNRTAKICDFGLSRQVLNYANYMKTSKTPVPWRWLAVECMKEQKFSTASDVWAFGVVMWEIFSLGETPYGCYTYDLMFADKLVNGERLLKPAQANGQIYQIMHKCWKIIPEERATFEQLYASLKDLNSKPLRQTVYIPETAIAIPTPTTTTQPTITEDAEESESQV